MSVYLLHIDPPFKHARHYLGFAEHLKRRLDHHLAGQGSNLTRHAVKAGCKLTVVRTWKGKKFDRNFERKLHRQKNKPMLCPICRDERREVTNRLKREGRAARRLERQRAKEKASEPTWEPMCFQGLP